MIFNNEEKEWILKISKTNKIEKYIEFLLTSVLDAKWAETTKSIVPGKYNFEKSNNVWEIDNEKQVLEKIERFNEIYNYLIANGFLSNSEVETSPSMIPLPVKTVNNVDVYVIPPQIYDHLITNRHRRICVKEALKNFIDRKYKTNEEQELEKERDARKRAEILTIFIAAISIIATLLPFLYDLCTPNKETIIIIKEIQQPIEVIQK